MASFRSTAYTLSKHRSWHTRADVRRYDDVVGERRVDESNKQDHVRTDRTTPLESRYGDGSDVRISHEGVHLLHDPQEVHFYRKIAQEIFKHEGIGILHVWKSLAIGT